MEDFYIGKAMSGFVWQHFEKVIVSEIMIGLFSCGEYCVLKVVRSTNLFTQVINFYLNFVAPSQL